MVSVSPQRVSYFSNTLPYGELLALKPTWSQILALVKSAGILPSASTEPVHVWISCLWTLTRNKPSLLLFKVEKVLMLTSQGWFFFHLDWKEKCQPSHMIFITLASIFLESWYNIQSNYIIAFCILHNSLPLKLISYTHANDMIFFLQCSNSTSKKKR